MADLDPTVQKLLEALDSVSDSIRSGQDAFADSKDKSEEVTRKLDSELRKLGLTLKTVTNQEDDLVKKRTDRAKLEEEVNQKLKQSGKVREDATQAEVEHYKNTQKQNVLFETTLASMGRYIDANDKIVKSTVDLSQAQQKTIDKFKSQDQATEKFNDMMGGMGKTLGIFAAKAAFELLSAAVIGTYKGMVAAQDALFDGQRGQSVEAAEAAEKMRAMAGATERIGSMMTDLGTTIAGVGLAFAAVNPVIGLLTAAVGGLIAVLGYGTQASAEIQKREAELELKRAKLNDELYANFQKLSGASLTGAEGMTGVYNDLHKFGLTIKDFDKFGKVLQENTKNLALFGAGTVDGVKKFTETASTLVKSELGKTLETMGITVEEQMSHTAAYMTQQARFGLKSSQDQAAAAGKYIQELDKLAVLTGATRKEQEDARKAVMNVNQLRSAMIEAAESGQTEKAQELQRAFETASSMMAAGMKDEAGAFARLMAAGGTVDADTARAQQMYGGKGGLIEATRTGQGSEVDRLELAARGAYQQEARFASTTKLTGPIPGVTGQVGPIADLMTNIKNFAESQEKKNGMSLNDYLEKQRVVTDKATKEQRELEQKNREKALNQEIALMNRQDIAVTTMLTAGKTMLDAANKMLKSAGFNDKPSSTPGGVGSKESQVSQQFKAEREKKEALEVETRVSREKLEKEKGRAAEEVKIARLAEFEAKRNAEKARAFEQHALRQQSMTSTWGGSNRPQASAPTLSGGSTLSSSNEQLKDAGLRIKSGDVQAAGSKVDPKLLEIAKQAQATIPGFNYFSAFNDNFHNEKSPNSLHTKGLAFDFTVNPGRGKSKPSKEDSDHIIKLLKDMGIDSVINEYDNPSSKSTGGHFHAELNMPKAYDGGLFDGPASGYPVEMHKREAIVPLPDPSSKISVETPATASKTPLSSVLTNSSNSEMDGKMLKQLFSMMENKFDEMIRKLDTGNDYSDKLVKAMA